MILKRCKILGMPVINRSPKSCVHQTSFCKEHCYNKKLYKTMFGSGMRAVDTRNDLIWQCLSAELLKSELKTDKSSNKRIRLMARGEAFSTINDIYKVADWIKNIPDWLFWIPTRAWRASVFKHLIEEIVFPLANHRIMASIDPSNSYVEIENLKKSGWSTMFFGDDNDIKDRVLCHKTWSKAKHRCICRNCNICFSDKRIDVHLKNH